MARAKIIRMSAAAALLALLLCPAPLPAADQPQWGQWQTRNMVSSETGLPDSLDAASGRNIRWNVPLGTQTFGSPIVAGGRVYIATNNGNPRNPRVTTDRGILMCFSEKDGAFLWQLAVPKLEEDRFFDWPNVGMCSPVTVEGDRAYVVTNRGEVVCLDVRGMANGNDGPFMDEARHQMRRVESPVPPDEHDADILWLYDIRNELNLAQHDSAHASILIDGPFLYLNTSVGVDNTHKVLRTPNAPTMIVLEKASGRLVAVEDEGAGRKVFHCNWSSPSLGVVNGRRLVFFIGGNGVCYAFPALTQAPPAGQVIKLKAVWRFDTDPTAPKEDIHSYLGNRKQSPSNSYGMPVFADGRVFLCAGGDIFWGKRQSWLKCIDPGGSGDITASGLRWSFEVPTHTLCTPAVADGLVYMTDCGRMIHCLDEQSGKAVWSYKAGGEIWSSPVVADGKVYVGTRRGELIILAHGRRLRVLCTADLGAPINGTPAIANGAIYVATFNRMYAIGERR